MNDPNHDLFMARAIELARTGLDDGEFPIAALVVLKNEVIAESTTTEKLEKRFLCHAEMNVLQSVDQMGLSFSDRQSAVLYSTLEPCLMCFGACMSAFIGHLHFALHSPSDGATSFVEQFPTSASFRIPTVIVGYRRLESRQLFQLYVERQPDGPKREWARSLLSEDLAPS